MRCPSFENLIDYFDNAIEEPERTRVAAHLATGCLTCAESLTWYERVRLVSSSDDSVGPPEWVFKRAVRVFDTVQRPRIAERIGKLVASLVFDSFGSAALAGVRSSETVNRQLLYRAGNYNIDLQIAPVERKRADLVGQVLKEGEANFESVSGLNLVIEQGKESVYSAVTNEMGEFKVSGMKYGVYKLRIELSEGHITVSDLPLVES